MPLVNKKLVLTCAVLFWPLVALGQTGTIGSATDGTTPSALAPATDDFMTVNPYNGKLSVALPLLKVGGRGSAGYTMTLPVDQTWTARQFTVAYQCMNGTCPGPATYYNATLNWWTGMRPGFTAGVVQGRRVGGFETQSLNGSTPELYGIGQRYLPPTPGGGNNIVVTGTQNTLSRLSFIGPDNSEVELHDQLTGGRPNSAPCNNQTPGFNRGRIFVSADGSGITFVSDSDVSDIDCSGAYPVGMTANSNVFSVSGYLHFKNGAVYRIDNGAVSWIRDADGNQTTFPSGGGVTDALGRQITFSSGTDYTQVNFNGVAGTPRTLRVYYAWLSTVLRSDQTIQTYHQLFPEIYNETDSPGPYPFDTGGLISKVQLPDGRFYRFYYNSYAELARVELPTGAAIEYDYQAGVDVPARYSGVLGYQNKEIYRRVAERRLYPNGGSGATYEKKTTYSRNTSDGDSYYSSSAAGSVIVKDLDSNNALLAQTTHYYYGSPAASLFLGWDSPSTYSSWKEGKEYQTDVFAQDGTSMLRRVTLDWQQRAPISWWSSWCQQQDSFCSSYLEPPNDPRVIRTTTTLADSNLVAKQEFAYDQFNNATDTWEYDFGAGAPPPYPTRHTHTEYLTSNNGLDYTSIDAHLRSLPRLAQVYAVNTSNGAETITAQTEIFYDEPAYPAIPYESITGWSAPPTAARGRVTTTRRWLNFNGSTLFAFPDGTYLTTHAQYDQCGSVRKTWDSRDPGLTNPTQVSYSDAFSDGVPRNTYAFPTSMTTAVPDPTGAFGSNVAFTTTSVFDFDTGKVVSTTDGNAKTTSYDYSDPLNRLKQVSMPDPGRVRYNYSDAPGDLYVQVLTDEDSSRSIETRQYFDGLGRPIRGFLYDGTVSTPWLVTDTYYDPMGRVSKVSNPYRVSSPSSSVPASCSACTTSAYDALGRITTVTTPDNAVVITTYSGNTVTVTDQTGKQRKSVSDGLGRLAQVYEDPNGSNYLTTYTYDTLDNLTTVSQGAQTRTFVYDSLKRLTSATNPESGTIDYQYDNNGNLTQKTDARPVTTTYAYDALNRNITVNYSNTTIGNPDVADITRVYDSATNGKGRLRESYAGGNETVGATVEHTKIQSYDALGRPLDQRQRFKTNSVWSAEYQTQRGYNLAGAVTSQVYPSGHTVAYAYDNAGRSNSFSGNLGDGTNRTYSTGIIYSAMGGMTKEQFGTDTPVYNKLFYNSRGQLAEIRESTSYTGPTDTTWDRGAIINHYSNQSGCWGASCNATDNNGNLRRQEVYIPRPNSSDYDNLIQSYDYDSLNRLQSVSEKLNGGAVQWQQDYVYDRWGNRTIHQTNTWGSGINKKDFTVNTANNRLGVPGGQSGTMTYDAAGNLTTDTYSGLGVTRVYDAENRMTSETQASSYLAGSYTYNADGQRVRRIVPVPGLPSPVETWQVYGMDGELLAEYAASSPGVSNPQKEYGYRNRQLLITAEASARENQARSATGATATAQNYTQDNVYPGHHFQPGYANDGQRYMTPPWGDNYWRDEQGLATWLQIEFTGTKTIDEVDVYTVQDYPAFLAGSDPGASETFGTWGATAFTVQYWTGSGWATVNGGTITGNNLVWRKLNFTAVTTTKIRVTVNAAVDGVARIAEVEAWGGGSANINWLVADQLGTPRMVLDKTGSLANVKRHDYLPFGEEIPAGTGGRTTALGYAGDNLRQKFTSKERDNETGLDYFGARYSSSLQGRFTSADPLLASAESRDPQTWNRYTYVTNNPLGFTDPTGERRNPVTGRRGINPVPANGTLGGVRSNRGNPHVGEWGMTRNGGTRAHWGTDITAPIGTDLVAMESGTVTYVRANDVGQGGRQIHVLMADGTVYKYFHLSAIPQGIAVNSAVAEGQVIAVSGNSGNAGGLTANNEDHVHVSIIGVGAAGNLNPVDWLNDPNASVPVDVVSTTGIPPPTPVTVAAGTANVQTITGPTGTVTVQQQPIPPGQAHVHPPPR